MGRPEIMRTQSAKVETSDSTPLNFPASNGKVISTLAPIHLQSFTAVFLMRVQVPQDECSKKGPLG